MFRNKSYKRAAAYMACSGVRLLVSPSVWERASGPAVWTSCETLSYRSTGLTSWDETIWQTTLGVVLHQQLLLQLEMTRSEPPHDMIRDFQRHSHSLVLCSLIAITYSQFLLKFLLLFQTCYWNLTVLGSISPLWRHCRHS